MLRAKIWLGGACLGLIVGACCSPATAADFLRTVALSGDAAEGLANGVTIASPARPTISPNGDLLFSATVAGQSVDAANDVVLYTADTGGRLTLLAREGDPVGGLDDVRYGLNGGGFSFDYGSAAFTGSGHAVFSAWLVGPGVDSSNNSVLVRATVGGGLTLLGREGDQAASLGAGAIVGANTASPFGSPVVNEQGEVATRLVYSPTASGGQGTAIVRYDQSGALEVLAQPGAPSSELGGGLTWRTFSDFLSLNDAGQTANYGSISLDHAGVTLDNDATLNLSDHNGALTLLVREGQPAPQAGAGAVFSGPTPPRLNGVGDTVFATRLSGPAISGDNDSALYRADENGGLTLLVREGDPAVGFGPLATIGQPVDAVINDAGEVAFNTRVRDSSSGRPPAAAVYLTDPQGELRLVVKAGDLLGNDGSDLYFQSPQEILGSAVLNGAGQLAFRAFLQTVPQDQLRHDSILAVDRKGDLQVIAREGGLLNVSDDPASPDYRVIDDLLFSDGSSNSDGRSTGFNDAGELTFSARFTDGTSGVFVSTLATIPEPSALVLLLFALAAPRGRRNRG